MASYDKRALAAANVCAVAIAAAFFFLPSSIQPLYPYGGTETQDRTPLFQWTGNAAAYELIIDDDPAFGSPLSFETEKESFEAPQMDFGTYWWKVRSGNFESAPRQFTVVSSVALSRPRNGTIENAGNADLIVQRSAVTGAVTLAVNESIEIGEDESVKAQQK